MLSDDELAVGDPVSKVGGDYRFDGVIVSKFRKLVGAVRYVVEDDRGVLHIYSAKNLAFRKAEPQRDDEVERLRLLNEDKFRHLQGYCKAADEDRAELARLRAAVATLAGACRKMLSVHAQPCPCAPCTRAADALAAAEPRPAGDATAADGEGNP